MPELPEVETVRRGLARELPGKSIVKVRVLRKESVAHPAVKSAVSVLSGKTFRAVERRGKYLLFHFHHCDCLMVAHLRMSGKFLLVPESGRATRFARVEMKLDDNRYLVFDDMRVFGRLWILQSQSDLETEIEGLAGLGPEPLEGKLQQRYLETVLAGKKQSIKAAILDQRNIAGIGNIYADESLHLARIYPARQAGSLTGGELQRFIQSIESVLENAIAAGGSTIRDYVNSEGINGNYQGKAYVYGREGEECRTCGSIIERMKIAGRSSFFCPCCQIKARQPRPQAKRAVESSGARRKT